LLESSPIRPYARQSFTSSHWHPLLRGYVGRLSPPPLPTVVELLPHRRANIVYNFMWSTTIMSGVSPFKVVYEIWISNLRDSNIVFVDNMISNNKVVNYKVS
jgi:hypothetical protein